MQSGTNKLTVLASDISGNGYLGLTSGWSVEGEIGGLSVDTITSTVSASGGDGFYTVTLDLPAGQGYVQVKQSNTNVSLTPTFFDLVVDAYSIDQVYGKLTVINVGSLPVGSPGRYSTVQLSTKQDADVIETIQVPSKYLPLTGYTNMTVQCFPKSRLTDSTVPPISGSYSATVFSETDGLVEIHIGDDVLGNVIPQGSASEIVYGDLKFFDAGGNERRPVELQITVRRDFNNNN
jgi:hypothetical protein